MLILNSDGGCFPNPGRGTYGFVVRLNGQIIAQGQGFIPHATCNIAEWRGAIAALDYLVGYTLFEPCQAELRMDSQLVVNQLTGRWRTKNKGLKPLQAQGLALVGCLKQQGVSFRVRWVPRDENTDADALT